MKFIIIKSACANYNKPNTYNRQGGMHLQRTDVRSKCLLNRTVFTDKRALLLNKTFNRYRFHRIIMKKK